MQVESQTLIDFVVEEMFDSAFGIALDVHSGFGLVDRLWYPYARQQGGYEHEVACTRLADRLAEYDAHHVYRIEPQSKQYTTHGDLWDYAYDRHRSARGANGRVFLPWTLEMGSWAWVRKNPSQLFNALGAFNPIKPHRYARTMRRHSRLVDFLWTLLLSGPETLSPHHGAAAPGSR